MQHVSKSWSRELTCPQEGEHLHDPLQEALILLLTTHVRYIPAPRPFSLPSLHLPVVYGEHGRPAGWTSSLWRRRLSAQVKRRRRRRRVDHVTRADPGPGANETHWGMSIKQSLTSSLMHKAAHFVQITSVYLFVERNVICKYIEV